MNIPSFSTSKSFLRSNENFDLEPNNQKVLPSLANHQHLTTILIQHNHLYPFKLTQFTMRPRSEFSPSLSRNQACLTCRSRKVRCSGSKPGCDACKRSAAARGKDPSLVVCEWPIPEDEVIEKQKEGNNHRGGKSAEEYILILERKISDLEQIIKERRGFVQCQTTPSISSGHRSSISSNSPSNFSTPFTPTQSRNSYFPQFPHPHSVPPPSPTSLANPHNPTLAKSSEKSPKPVHPEITRLPSFYAPTNSPADGTSYVSPYSSVPLTPFGNHPRNSPPPEQSSTGSPRSQSQMPPHEESLSDSSGLHQLLQHNASLLQMAAQNGGVQLDPRMLFIGMNNGMPMEGNSNVTLAASTGGSPRDIPTASSPGNTSMTNSTSSSASSLPSTSSMSEYLASLSTSPLSFPSTSLPSLDSLDFNVFQGAPSNGMGSKSHSFSSEPSSMNEEEFQGLSRSGSDSSNSSHDSPQSGNSPSQTSLFGGIDFAHWGGLQGGDEGWNTLMRGLATA